MTNAPRLSVQIVAAAIGMSGGFAVLFIGTFGVFVKPISAELHWSRAEASLLVTTGFLGYALGAPIIGWLFDRLGPRPVLLTCIALFAAGLAALGSVGGGPLAFAATAMIVGLAGAGNAPSGYILVLSKIADRRLGMTLGLAMLGLGIGTTVIPVVTQALISQIGWHGAYLALALLSVVLGGLALLLGFGRGFPLKARLVEPTESHDLDGLTLGDAVRSWRFWLIALTALVLSAIAFGTTTHLPAIFSDRGFDPAFAARSAGMAGAGLFVGRLGAAILMDRLYAPLIACLCCALGAIGLYCLQGLRPDDALLAYFAPLLVGLLAGSEGDTMPYFTRRYFGAASFGSIYGSIVGLAAIGGLSGPLVFGRFFDIEGNYTMILLVSAAAAAICGAALMTLGPYRYAPPKDVSQ